MIIKTTQQSQAFICYFNLVGVWDHLFVVNFLFQDDPKLRLKERARAGLIKTLMMSDCPLFEYILDASCTQKTH